MTDTVAIASLLKEYAVRRRDAITLLAHRLGHSHHELFFRTHVDIPKSIRSFVHDEMRRLASGEPISKIIQRKEFYGIEFKTNEHTLDPRPETELIVDLVTRLLLKSTQSELLPGDTEHRSTVYSDVHEHSSTGSTQQESRYGGGGRKTSDEHCSNFDECLTILDLGCGTGCIGLSLLTMYPNAVCSFVDIDAGALAVAAENACNLGVGTRCEFILSDWFTNVSGTFDIIVCNPPYVSTNFELDTATSFDPSVALFAGEDGMDAYAAILPKMKDFLNYNGKAFIEVGFDQSEKVINIEHGLHVMNISNDLSGIPRVITMCLCPSLAL
ncbi:MAG: HemK family protein methyltransferase [Holosporales bacterium]|jgi:release factor glutamine methyltransferase|nr:HemK family protein methyltransferase [Holosporales bacterium]